MKKAMKRLLSLLLCACMALSLLPTAAFASGSHYLGESQNGDLHYIADSDQITIVGCDDTATDVTIPAAIAGLPVTTISRDAFNNHPKLESVVIPSSVTTIEAGCEGSPDNVGAFAGCEKLSFVTLSASLTEISRYTFAGCTALTSIDLSGLTGLTGIGEGAFYGSGLTSVTFPTDSDSFASIGDYAFYHARLTSVVIPDSVTTIGYAAFYGCGETDELTDEFLPSLASATLGSGVETIEGRAFVSAAITSIVLPDSLTSIGREAFGYCSSLTSVTWPDNPAFTEVTGFCGCTSLPVSVFDALPDSVTAIGGAAFAECSFTSLIIPARIRTICHYSSHSYFLQQIDRCPVRSHES